MPETPNDEAIETVHLRNDFYRDNYRRVVWALMGCVILILFLASTLSYIVTHPPEPRYFATTVDGRIEQLPPLNIPNLSQAALLQWANTAAVAVYTYNFVNYRQALTDAEQYFTSDGWNAFKDALVSSNNLNAVIDKKLIVSAVATGAPIILQEGMLEGRYAWKIQIPMLVTYQSASEFSRQPLVITMLIVRVSTLSSPLGIAIAQLIAAPGGVNYNGGF